VTGKFWNKKDLLSVEEDHIRDGLN